MLAYACSPEMGSEPSVGWHRALAAAREFDTWVICEGRWCEPSVRRYLALHGPIPHLTFVFVSKGRALRLLTRTPGGYYPAYNLWHRRAFRVARRLHNEQRFDLVHQVTFCGYREPGYLWELDVPFVWGPVGGTQNCPWRFLSEAGLVGGLSEAVRTCVNRVQVLASRRVRLAVRRASPLLAANVSVARDLQRAHGIRPIVQLETGLASNLIRPRRDRRGATELRILWSGELRPFKALSLLLKALAQLPPESAYALRVVGHGPAWRRWRRLATRIGVAHRVAWLGWLPHCDAVLQYQWADLFAFTSLRDTSGNVVLEALGAGLPVICLDHQGAHDIVTDRCGVKIPVTTPREVVCALRDAMLWLASDEAVWRRLSHGASDRAQELSWGRQAERMATIYRSAATYPATPVGATG